MGRSNIRSRYNPVVTNRDPHQRFCHSFSKGVGYVADAAVIESATANARAMIVIWGLTSGQLGRIEASATHTPRTPRSRPSAVTGDRCPSPPARAVPTGWNAASFSLLGFT